MNSIHPNYHPEHPEPHPPPTHVPPEDNGMDFQDDPLDLQPDRRASSDHGSEEEDMMWPSDLDDDPVEEDIHNDPPVPPQRRPVVPDRVYHPHLTGEFALPSFHHLSHTFEGAPCDEFGITLPPNSAPLPWPVKANPAAPFSDTEEFEVAEFLFTKAEMSAGNINYLMSLWARKVEKYGTSAPFANAREVYDLIDAIEYGEAPWETFSVKFSNDAGPNSPGWKTNEYPVYYRNPDTVVTNLLANPDFDGLFDYQPYREFNEKGKRRYNEFMSGQRAWEQCVSATIFYV